jgi:hypothetical protein
MTVRHALPLVLFTMLLAAAPVADACEVEQPQPEDHRAEQFAESMLWT